MRIGSALAFLGTRMAKRTVNTVERKIVWSGIGAVLGTIAVVFFLIAAYEFLIPAVGRVWGAGLLALVCALLGVLAFFAPTILAWLEKQFGEKEIKPMEAIHQEAHAVVDQFGPFRVGLTAFLLGLSAGRTVRGAVARK